jgi:hypothetical protein
MVALQALAHAPRVASDGAAGLLASGSLYSRAFPRGQPPARGIHRAQWRFPVSFPVTVAGAAPDSNRLPFRRRASLR